MAGIFQDFSFRRWRRLFLVGLIAVVLSIASPTWAMGKPEQDIQRLDSYIQQAIAKAETGDLSSAEAAFKQYNTAWFDIEDGVKETSRPAYRSIETTMNEVKFAFSTQPKNKSQLLEKLKSLHDIDQKFISDGFSSAPAKPASASGGKVTIDSLMERLNRADGAIGKNDITTARSEMKAFQTDWLEVEGVVATKSKQAYVDIENNMAKANGFLRTNPPDVSSAKQAIVQLQQDLQPYAGNSVHYSFVDAALILLREGLEAIVVLIALLAFLNKSGNSDKSYLLWIGAGLGILASISIAIVVQAFFSGLSAAGTNREVLEGTTGLIASAMLFYVSYWLHSKSSVGAWQNYIKGQVTSALATNSVISLALLAFLAIFREGGETVLFYIGMAPAISKTDLWGGLVAGAGILAVIAVLMFRLGTRIPLKPFFLVTSLLIYYLGFKFVGNGIHALQVSGILPASPANFLPSWEPLGLYPTWQTILPQAIILLVAVAIVLRDRTTRLSS